MLERLDKFTTAQQLHAKLTAQGSNVGLATVYRTLQLLEADGDVDAIRDDQGEMLYRWCARASHHHHLVCRTCGKAVEVAGQGIESWADDVAAANGFVDVDHTIELFGTCADCK